MFGTLNTGLLHQLPGTTFSNTRQRGDYDSVKNACVGLDVLVKALHLFLLDEYAEDFHRGLGGIPARKWEAAMKDGVYLEYPARGKNHGFCWVACGSALYAEPVLCLKV